MPTKPVPRFAVLLAAVAALLSPALARAETFPPLNSPASAEHNPGKFVWADLFTSDPAAATTFYTKLFGWTSTTLFQKGKAYTVFSNGNHPVAGLVTRNANKTERASRWIGYIAVNDAAATLATVAKAGGKVHAPVRDFPDRGRQAIVGDNEGAPIGLLQSASGDSADSEPRPGDWNWFELFAQKPADACRFYDDVFGYTSASDDRTERKGDFLLSTGDHPRAGIAPLPSSDDTRPPGWLGVIRVANLDAILAQVVPLGGEVKLAPRPAAYETRFAIITDPTGGTIGLVEYVDNSNPAAAPLHHENTP